LNGNHLEELAADIVMGIWLQVARGNVAVNEHEVAAGDGVAITDEDLVAIRGLSDSEVLLFDMA